MPHTFDVTVVPGLPAGSAGEISWVEVNLFNPAWGSNVDSNLVYSWPKPLEPGRPVTLTLSADWFTEPTPLEVRVEVHDTLGRTATSAIPVTLVP